MARSVSCSARNGCTQTVSVKTNTQKIVLIRALVVTLLVSLAGLSTLAKNNQYLPKSDSARYLSIASKMKADSDGSPAPIELHPAQPEPRILIPEPVLIVTSVDRWEAPFVPRISLSVCLRHRAPPVTPSE
jgi:hypothetical protein